MWNINLPPTKYFELSRIQNDPLEAHAFQAFINEASAQPKIAIDTETTGLVSWKDIPLYWSVAWKGARATLHANVLHHFAPVFAQEKKDWLMANAKYDTHILANVGVNLAGRIVDTCVMHALLFEEQPHGLKYMAQHLLGWTYGDFQDQFGKITKKNTPTDVIRRAEQENMNLLIEYAANDAWATWEVYNDLRDSLSRATTYSLFRDIHPYIETLWDLFDKVETDYTRALWKMERHGILADRSQLEKAEPQFVESLNEIDKEITRIAGYPINPGSTQQLQDYFFTKKGYTPSKQTKSGAPSVDVSVLKKLRTQGDPVAKLLLEYREQSKLLGTYIRGLHKLLDPNDRIHTRFNQDVARCMPAGELVLTDRGYIPVETVKKGDSVVTHKGRTRKVIETSTHRPQTIYKVTTSDGHVLRTTGNHKYCTPSGWVRADRLETGSTIITHSCAERWASIPGWEDYGVSSWGRVENYKTGKRLKLQRKNKWGHLRVTLRNRGRKKDFGVHQLVLLAFVGEKPTGEHEVRHLNGISWDNTLENLTYGTSQENSQDAIEHGTALCAPKLTWDQVEEIRTAERAGQPPSSAAKLTYEDAEDIRRRYAEGEGRAELAREYDISYQAADNIVKDRTWVKKPGGVSATELAKKYGISPAAVRDIWAGRRWEPAAVFGSTTVKSVEKTERNKTYGLTVEEDHSHVTGGIVTHNTGRLSSAGPNLQNIPSRTEQGKKIREAFIAPPGHTLLAVDYEQLEMRLLAAAAMERDMISIFERNWDIHMGNASLMFGIPYEDLKSAKKVDKQVKSGELGEGYLTPYVLECLDARAAAKAIGFGLNYGMGAGKLGRTLGISREEAQKKINQYMQTYPAVAAFFKEAVEETEKTGYAFTILGRRRNVPEIMSYRKSERALGERVACNTQIQGSAADVCKMAQINLMKVDIERRYGCKMLLQVHDELVFECPNETVEDALVEIKDLMEHPFSIDLVVRLAVDAGRGSSWGDAK